MLQCRLGPRESFVRVGDPFKLQRVRSEAAPKVFDTLDSVVVNAVPSSALAPAIFGKDETSS
jgi:hypothetical protein